jgi:pyridoxine 5'-phosphate synthase PdxJ
MTATHGRRTGVEQVACEVCLKEVPASEAVVPEAQDYVAYFCGLDCYQKWKTLRQAPENAGSAVTRHVTPQEPASHSQVRRP